MPATLSLMRVLMASGLDAVRLVTERADYLATNPLMGLECLATRRMPYEEFRPVEAPHYRPELII